MLNIHNSSDNHVVILSSDVDESAPLQVFLTSTLHHFYVKVVNGNHINGSCHRGIQNDTLSGALGTGVSGQGNGGRGIHTCLP